MAASKPIQIVWLSMHWRTVLSASVLRAIQLKRRLRAFNVLRLDGPERHLLNIVYSHRRVIVCFCVCVYVEWAAVATERRPSSLVSAFVEICRLLSILQLYSKSNISVGFWARVWGGLGDCICYIQFSKTSKNTSRFLN